VDGGDQPVAGPLPAHRTTQTHNKRTQTSILQVGFESTIPAFERVKTVHALDRAATVIGECYHFAAYVIVTACRLFCIVIFGEVTSAYIVLDGNVKG
jgi:hypothetical protein